MSEKILTTPEEETPDARRRRELLEFQPDAEQISKEQEALAEYRQLSKHPEKVKRPDLDINSILEQNPSTEQNLQITSVEDLSASLERGVEFIEEKLQKELEGKISASPHDSTNEIEKLMSGN